ncbi:RING finger protein PFF0165c-like [Vespa crabro]|uniref:RING finger protein PFF0165c-like n=1 Tax=Vespa crabro TaxID=7445 RepID=UPI001F021C04|nr:RING finger protein PFF0165c-like [Vespa crabro]
MAMLAEPRRKQKWTLNPRGKDWSNDTNKFGQRMLEKMGWTAGKGLGINEQGTTQHVKVKVKTDTVGIGFKNNQDKAWTEHQKAFDSFLNLLQENQDSEVIKKTNTENSVVNTQSLELKSKQSRARVHYQKFTRGKDVKKYSAKDLADILGDKHILNKESKIEGLQKDDANVTNTAPVENITEGTITINRGSITDYFKKKTSHFLKNKENNTSCMDVSDNEIEQYRGFGFVSKSPNCKQTNKSKFKCNYTFDNPALDLHNSDDVPKENTKCLNKRKGDSSIENDMQNLGYEENSAKKIKIDDNDTNSKEGFINMALDLDTDVNESCVTNKFEVPRVKLGLTNDALDLTDEIHEKKRVTFNNHVEYSTDFSKKKKHTGTLDKFEVDSKKRKKKQKQLVYTNPSNKIGFINEGLDINLIPQELKDNKVNECKSKSKKKKKQEQRKISNLETIEETSEEASTNNGRQVENLNKNLYADLTNEKCMYEENNIDIKKKKKKSKNKTHEIVTVTDDIDDTISYIPEDINYSQKKEKIKKKKKHIAMNDDVTYEKITEKAKCKKKFTEKHKYEENIINIPLDKNEEHLVIEETIIDDKPTEKSKHKRKRDKKHVNKELKCKLEDRKNEEVLCEKVQDNDEEIKVKANIKHDIISQKTFDNTNKNDRTIVEKNVSDMEMQLQDVEHSKIDPEENMTVTKDINFCGENPKMSKRILKSFFDLDYILDFPGSNIKKIKGYGADIFQ